ncbi:class I SAM-dependent methyltransferase [Stappia sp. F7233]|uniref:Class I SAM-dependent methyltransferase n=1 Tax=Stappia albiluteola TaxID=2758565 RepID=A0A839ACD0_9HYPH|nr:class I SAM-dependent methyltransferase [Stappia albiluteola]MBA5776329.1 class I SAM-dependent methyltransferase [Stappia albiluteola]
MAPSPVATLATRARFIARQGARVAWFAAHGEALKRLNRRLKAKLPENPRPFVPPSKPVPSQSELLAGIAALFRRDLANVEAGIYPLPRGEFGSPGNFLSLSRHFFEDAPKVARRRAEGSHQEVYRETKAEKDSLPRYYRQNFHFQTDGWLSDESARLYDFQVEVLFTGATAAMRRQGLLPLAEILRQRDQRKVAYADIACGTGGLLAPALAAFPRLKGVGVDLSEAYMNEARSRLRPSEERRATFISAPAEALPFGDESLDILSTVYLFHELPPEVRRQVAAEFSRALKPGGRLIFIDSLQTGERPAFDGLLEVFPQLFHEPYFASYLSDDLDGIFAATGLRLASFDTAFLSRIAVYEKV